MQFDLTQTDELLATTRSPQENGLDKPVPREIIEECIELSQQALTGGNSQGWRWMTL